MLHKLLLVALAGSLGTRARYGLTGAVHRITGSGTFPWGTMTVNVLGCFLGGFLWSLFESRWPASAETRTMVLVGFMGAFTTFSTFILETHHMVRAADWISAGANLALQICLGMAVLFTGAALGRIV